MSDFDKEAEREKLRKKFEAEEERRETTQQMSELLLKGATMLNVHCADCAAPIFRHNGEEFCPTCRRPVEELTTAGPGDLTGPGGPVSGEAATETPSDQPIRNESNGPAEIEVEGPEADVDVDAEAPETPADESEPAADDRTESAPAGDVAPSTSQAPSATETSSPAPSASPDGAQEQAFQSLAATITRLSERAAAADDPRQAQELLAAANEAAEVLQRLRQRQ